MLTRTPNPVAVRARQSTNFANDFVSTQKPIRADVRWQAECIDYSICTIVTKHAEYMEMVDSFERAGFREPDCEYLCLDNTKQNLFDAYAGNNLFLNVARGEFVILCHQDVLLMNDGRAKLDAIVAILSRLDPKWMVCGNAGCEHLGRLAIRITDPHGKDQRVGVLPAKVLSLDENFNVVRRGANLSLSHDVEGFHLYGADLCLIADVLGGNSYVIDFHLHHTGAGTTDESCFEIRERLIQKYRRAFRSRWMPTTCTSLFVSGTPLLGGLLSHASAIRAARFVARSADWFNQTEGVVRQQYFGRVLSAGIWSLAGLGLGQTIRFGSNLLMTRLLVPEMFGV